MQVMCWACDMEYDDSLEKCPNCGYSKEPPGVTKSVKVAEKKPEVKKIPAKPVVKKPSGRK